MKKELTIVIPNRLGENPELTIRTLFMQDYQNFDIIIINDLRGNANIARNAGFKLVETPYVLFSDNDIQWAPGAIKAMMNCLKTTPDISFAYGYYELNGKVWCNSEWDTQLLKHRNNISTMTIVRTAHHPGFDPYIKRLQDWDVWLTMMAQGYKGKYINQQIFTTPVRDGITRSSVGWDEAIGAIKQKHNI
jgi:glycosyltransferase involved in cell wall biosynthesis